ncbi:hypothetical protein BDZ97DRAFT_1836916 [Flammula alnicola]|nr:hypothetical protein BDZ97DRAFT_1836916 [Flammula alnicola]
MQIPDGLAHSFYQIDMHQNSSVYSPLLASSNTFEIVPPSTSSLTSATATQTSQSSSTTTQATNTPQSQSTSPPTASTTGIPHKSNGSVIGAAVGGTIGGIALILLALLLFCRLRRRNVRQTVLINDHVVSPYDPPVEHTSPFAASYHDRQFIPSQPSLTRVSPFVLDVERQTQTSSDPSIAKNRELVIPHVHNALSTDSSWYLTTGLPRDQLRNERERLLVEISALRSGAGQSTFSASSVAGTDTSGRADSDSSDMRNRLEQLTEHVRRLETALERATQVYDAPPTYNASDR